MFLFQLRRISGNVTTRCQRFLQINPALLNGKLFKIADCAANTVCWIGNMPDGDVASAITEFDNARNRAPPSALIAANEAWPTFA